MLRTAPHVKELSASFRPRFEIVGLKPWLPWPLSRWRLWTDPIPAERLAALRIGIAALLLFDILTTYLPLGSILFGGDSLGHPGAFAYHFKKSWLWSLFQNVEDHRLIQAGLIAWSAATGLLLLGFWTRTSALAVWILSTSFATINPFVDNGGDEVRGIILFYLVLCPCGAVWSVDAWLKKRKSPIPSPAPVVMVNPWPVRLLFLQMTVIYCFTGLYKLLGKDWAVGVSLHYVLADLTLTRWSYAQFAPPAIVLRWLSRLILAWEVSFPLLICWRPTRILALWLGVAFHLGIAVQMELGCFGFYMLCLYLPLVPWERWTRANDTMLTKTIT